MMTIAPPRPEFIQALRSNGHTLKTAIADIIDNCVGAKARKVTIIFYFTDSVENSYIGIHDDGVGMNEKELEKAMEFSAEFFTRDQRGLGRFGIGMKIGPLSFCKSVTVMTRKNGLMCQSRWDVDHVLKTNKWQQLKQRFLNHKSQEKFLEDHFYNKNQGTVIFCEKLDRVLDDNAAHLDKSLSTKFALKAKDIGNYLGITHGDFIKNKNIIIQNGLGLIYNYWDPFCLNYSKTKKIDLKILKFDNKRIIIQGFILPRKQYFKDVDDYKKAGGPDGWNQHQGLYIYRGKRLITFGGWFGLKDGERLWEQTSKFNRVRIRIDIPVDKNIDRDWRINIQKTRAIIPESLYSEVREYVGKVRDKCLKLDEPKKIQNPKKEAIWDLVRLKGKNFYKINRDDPVIRDFLSQHKMILPDLNKELEQILKKIENNNPYLKK